MADFLGAHAHVHKQHKHDNALSPAIQKDLRAYLDAEIALREKEQAIEKLAAMLHTMKNVFYGIQMLMMDMMDMGGARLSGLADVDKIESTLRNLFSDAQDHMNGAQGKGYLHNKEIQKDLKKIVEIVDGVKAFLLKQQKEGKKSVFDGATTKNMLSAINNIQGAFGKDWGHVGHASLKPNGGSGMTREMVKWYRLVCDGKTPPQLKTIQDGFQTFNQSVSALSTTTNTRLQFRAEQFKQFMGIDKNTIESYSKLIRAEVNAQRSN